jgi:hypothetical protein
VIFWLPRYAKGFVDKIGTSTTSRGWVTGGTIFEPEVVTAISCEIQTSNMEIDDSGDSGDGDSFTILTVLNSDSEEDNVSDGKGVVVLSSYDSDFVILEQKDESQGQEVRARYSLQEVVKVTHCISTMCLLNCTDTGGD